MANATSEGNYYKKAVVDTAPGASGYASTAVPESVVRGFDTHRLTFSVEEGVGDVTLQFKGAGRTTWTDESGSPYTTGDVKTIDAYTHNREWRGICKNGDYTSGNLTFGIEW